MDNYTKFPNEILEAMFAYPFTRRQYAILLCLVRETYGWGKGMGAYISVAKMARQTGIKRVHIYGVVNDLEAMGVITVEHNGRGRASFIGVNFPSHWDQHVPKLGTPQNGDTYMSPNWYKTCPQVRDSNMSPKQGHIKEKKDIYQEKLKKEDSTPPVDHFDYSLIDSEYTPEELAAWMSEGE